MKDSTKRLVFGGLVVATIGVLIYMNRQRIRKALTKDADQVPAVTPGPSGTIGVGDVVDIGVGNGIPVTAATAPAYDPSAAERQRPTKPLTYYQGLTYNIDKMLIKPNKQYMFTLKSRPPKGTFRDGSIIYIKNIPYISGYYEYLPVKEVWIDAAGNIGGFFFDRPERLPRSERKKLDELIQASPQGAVQGGTIKLRTY